MQHVGKEGTASIHRILGALHREHAERQSSESLILSEHWLMPSVLAGYLSKERRTSQFVFFISRIKDEVSTSLSVEYEAGTPKLQDCRGIYMLRNGQRLHCESFVLGLTTGFKRMPYLWIW
jgi:hypothetical protein